MPRLKWYRSKHGVWYLKRRGNRVAELFSVPRGWLVCILPTITFAGPYGDFNVARQAAETRTHAGH